MRSRRVRSDAVGSASVEPTAVLVLLGTEDKAIPPELQRFMAVRANATIVEAPASHVSFVSQPEADPAHPAGREAIAAAG